MKTEVLAIDPTEPQQEVLKKGVKLLQGGLPLVFPTETVYGLGADAFLESAVQSIYAIKGRSFNKPLPVMIADKKMLSKIAKEIPHSANKLMKAFWPGPLTLILTAENSLSPAITAGNQSVGVRFPDHPVPLNLIRLFGKPIVATSANISGSSSPTTASQALKELQGRVPLILDGGPTQKGKESTVLDCTVNPVKILRVGALSPQDIQAVLNSFLVLFVCAGNTCRSPMAEGVFNHLVKQKNLNTKMHAESAGLLGIQGGFAAEFSILLCQEDGIDISAHRSRPLTKELAQEADLILTMTQAQKQEVLENYLSDKERVFTLKEFVGESGDIPDPIGLGEEFYRNVYREIKRGVEKVLEKLMQKRSQETL
jgi:tRNA threonylcarbamoyl adenosine modification protein (Sua5/YciO/YrdC/YwlC family)